jgi:DNA-directed RNA polymerases I and III subunit RPAC2
MVETKKRWDAFFATRLAAAQQLSVSNSNMSVNEHRPPAADKKFEVLEGSTSHSATYVLGDEDHTLGNALRHVLMQKAEVDFCGYSVPHPSEPKMNLRLQTTTKPAMEVFKSGLADLVEICNLLDERIDQMTVEEAGQDGDDAAMDEAS